jgi:hypothetical protein
MTAEALAAQLWIRYENRPRRTAVLRGVEMALAHRVIAALSYRDAAGRHSHRRVPDGLAGTREPGDR